MVCGIGAFKGHVKLHFFNGSAMPYSRGLFNHCLDNRFARSIRYTDVSEVDTEAPEDLIRALQFEPTAYHFFEGLTPGYKKQFIEHVATAKTDKTRTARIEAVVTHCREGRKLNDKYDKRQR